MHGEGPMLVIAGPGSGKTFTITSRIRYLIEQCQVPPERVLVITFTKEAALSMQQRFLESTSSYLPVRFGTFHSVFYHILCQSTKKHSFPILTNSQKYHLLLPILKQFPTDTNPYDAREHLQEDIASFLSAISYYKNTGDKLSAIHILAEDWRDSFDAVFTAYEQARKQEGAIDFDDMLYECRRLLQDRESVRRYWQDYFSYILIDEFQDMNPMQYEVVKLLAREPYSIFAVGDDDQSIYGFRGAKPACLQQFCKDFQAKKVYLNINYRSRAQIVELSLKVINENHDRFVKELRAKEESRQEDACVTLQAYPERGDQYESLCKQVQDYLNANPHKTCAVLFRTNAYMQGFATYLNREGIAYRMKERGMCVYDQPLCKDIMAYLYLANVELRRDMFLRIMNKPVRYLNRNALGQGEVHFRQLQAYYQCYGDKKYRAGILRAIEALQKQLEQLKGKTPYLAVQYIRKVIGYEQYLRKQKYRDADVWEECLELLEWLTEDAKHYESYEDWVEAQEAYRERIASGEEEDVSRKRKGGKEAADGRQTEVPQVQLMTIHASKGLEFHQVWIPDCNEKIIPHGSLLTEAQTEEERRLMYVAMTRAKENLGLLYLVGTKERPRIPSRFLNPILAENYSSSSTNSSNSQLSKYSSNASATFSYSSSSSMKLNSGSSLGSSGFSL